MQTGTTTYVNRTILFLAVLAAAFYSVEGGSGAGSCSTGK